MSERAAEDLGPLSSDPPGQLDVLWHDGHTLGVDGAQVGVLKQTNQVSLAGLLQKSICHNNVLDVQLMMLTWRAPMAADWNLRSVLKS